jgi:hypothetical protein
VKKEMAERKMREIEKAVEEEYGESGEEVSDEDQEEPMEEPEIRARLLPSLILLVLWRCCLYVLST